MKKDFIKYPSKKIVIRFTIAWFIGFVLQLLAATDLFTENPFKAKYFITNSMLLGSTLLVIKLHINYRKNQSSNNELISKS